MGLSSRIPQRISLVLSSFDIYVKVCNIEEAEKVNVGTLKDLSYTLINRNS